MLSRTNSNATRTAGTTCTSTLVCKVTPHQVVLFDDPQRRQDPLIERSGLWMPESTSEGSHRGLPRSGRVLVRDHLC